MSVDPAGAICDRLLQVIGKIRNTWLEDFKISEDFTRFQA